jgi:hypothetical protein
MRQAPGFARAAEARQTESSLLSERWIQYLICALCCVCLEKIYHTALWQAAQPALHPPRLAFFLTLHDAVPMEQAQRVWQAIYRPEHWYLVHVDVHSAASYHQAP